MGTRSLLLIPAFIVLDAASACPQVVLNEVLPAPGTDWTDNGIFSSQEDEWLELFNAGASTVDLAGYHVTDASGTPRIGLSGTLEPAGHLFLSGEHAVDWESTHGFPAVGLSLNNSGDTVYLFQAAGGATTLVDSLAYSSADVDPDVSLGRWPDGGATWSVFDALTEGGTGAQPTPGGANGGIASPKILSTAITPPFPTSEDAILVRAVNADSDGIVASELSLRVNEAPATTIAMSLVEGSAAHGTWEAVLPAHAAGTVLGLTVRVSDGTLLAETNEIEIVVAGASTPVALNEILADPPPDLAGDANGDGVRSTSGDEFVELVNRSETSTDLTGWSLHDATGLRHEFAAGPVLAPGELFVVFGGGTPTGIPSGFEVASSGGLSLNNTADEVRLVGPDDVTRDFHVYGSEANTDQSLIRVPDGDGEWTRPTEAGFGWLFSPGMTNSAPSPVGSTSWGAVKGLYR